MPSERPTQGPSRPPTQHPTTSPTRPPTMDPAAPRVMSSSISVGTTTLDIMLTVRPSAYMTCEAVPPAGQGYDASGLPTLRSNATTSLASTARLRIKGATEGVMYMVWLTARNSYNTSASYLIGTVRMLDFTPPVVLTRSVLLGRTGLNITMQLNEPGNLTCRAYASSKGNAGGPPRFSSIQALLSGTSSSVSRLSRVLAEAYRNQTVGLWGLELGRNFSVFCYVSDRALNTISLALVQAGRINITTVPALVVETGADGATATCETGECTLRSAMITAAGARRQYGVIYPIVLTQDAVLADAISMAGAGVLVDLRGLTGNEAIRPLAGIATRLFTVSDHAIVLLRGLRLEGGNATEGGLISATGKATVKITSCVLASGLATGAGGGAVFVSDGARLALADCKVCDNSAVNSTSDPGTAARRRRHRLLTAAASSDELSAAGGSILATNGATLSAYNVTFVGGVALSGGGAVAVLNGSIFTANATYFRNNTVLYGDGGACLISSHSTVSMTGALFAGNQAGEEGSSAFVSTGAALTLIDTAIRAEEGGQSALGSWGGTLSLIRVTVAALPRRMPSAIRLIGSTGGLALAYSSIAVSASQSAVKALSSTSSMVVTSRNSVVRCGAASGGSCLDGVTLSACKADSCGERALCRYSPMDGITCTCPVTWEGERHEHLHVRLTFLHLQATCREAQLFHLCALLGCTCRRSCLRDLPAAQGAAVRLPTALADDSSQAPRSSLAGHHPRQPRTDTGRPQQYTVSEPITAE
jgi:hypothetical protein